MSENSDTFDKIQDGWLSLERAQYAFAPNYLSDTRKRRNALRSEAAEYFARTRIKADYLTFEVDIQVVFLGVVLTIEDIHSYSLIDQDDGSCDENKFPSTEIHLSGDTYEEFRDKLAKPLRNKRFEQAVRACAGLTHQLSRMYAHGFIEAVNSGGAVIYARARSPLNPFTRVFPDQWHHFRIVDAAAGTAEGPTGERLFSCHVRPCETQMDASELTAGYGMGAANSVGAAASRECKAWIIGLLKASPERRTHTMTELREQAVSRWGDGLAGRRLDRAYDEARREVDCPAWSKRGPKKRASN